MGLKAYISSSLKDLAKKMSEEIKQSNKSVFLPDFVITSNNGIKSWLKEEIANNNGIAANIQFLRMKQISSIIYKILGGKQEDKEELSVIQLQWMLFDIMGRDEFKNQFPDIANYFGLDFRKRFALAGKVAALFNKYQSIIPDKLSGWKKNTEGQNENEVWQRYLWMKLSDNIGDSFYTEIDTYEYIESKLKDTTAVSELISKLPVISIFNLNDLTRANIDLLIKISGLVQVNLYFFSPVKHLDVTKINNSLLENWIKNQKELLEYLNLKKVELSSLDQPLNKDPKTLLEKIQHDLIHNQEKSFFEPKDLKDESIVINSCYTQNREVEVLYNFLVKIVKEDKSKEIGAKDITVLCTDIDKYSSSIKAVFDTAPYRFPYHILDNGSSESDSPLRALESLFSIDPTTFKPEEVMHLLEYPAIMNRFEIKDVAMLRNLVNSANIRNGYTGDKVNETNLISWDHGMKRLLLGLCLSGDDAFQLNGESYLLLDKTEGSTGYDLVRFSYFVKSLKELLDNLMTHRTIEDWVEVTRNIIDVFLDTNKDPRMQVLDKELAGLTLIKDKISEAISFDTFFVSLKQIFSEISNENSSTKKGITFCSMLPSRSVPSKIIALLGLNYDSFPRKNTDLSFDLLLSENEAHAQNQREKDKYFFLQSVLNAKKTLYLSFIGRDVKNNKERPPSSLIDELEDYIKMKYKGDLEIFSIVTEHPLHSFDSKYFDDSLPQYYSFLGKNDRNSDLDIFKEPELLDGENGESKTNDDTDCLEISVHKIVNFFKDPFKYYYNNTLGIYYKDEEELLSSEELFELGTLEQWIIKTKLIRSAELLESEDARRKAVEIGEIPLATVGQTILKEINEKVKSARERFLSVTNNNAEEKVTVAGKLIPGICLKGSIGDVYGSKFVFNNVSSSETKYKIAAFIECLIINTFVRPADLYYNSINSNGLIIIESNKFQAESAKNLLKQLTEIFVSGSQRIISFTPELSTELSNLTEKGADREGIINSALSGSGYLSEYIKQEWENGFFRIASNREEMVSNLKLIEDSILSKFN